MWNSRFHELAKIESPLHLWASVTSDVLPNRYGRLWWPRRTLSVVHIDPDAWTPLPTFVFRRISCPDVRFPTREHLSRCSFSRRVNYKRGLLSRRAFRARRMKFFLMRFPVVRFPLRAFQYWPGQRYGLSSRCAFVSRSVQRFAIVSTVNRAPCTY